MHFMTQIASQQLEYAGIRYLGCAQLRLLDPVRGWGVSSIVLRLPHHQYDLAFGRVAIELKS